jgi:hypothetical protein
MISLDKEVVVTALPALWMPILVSAVAVFIVSSIIHMALPWHRDEYPQLPDEDGVMDALRPMKIPPGDYMVPRAGGMKEYGSPAFAEKLAEGPVMVLTVLPNGPMNMSRSLGMWFVYALVVSVLAAYLTGAAVAAGADYLVVFRFAGTVAFIGYSVALWQMVIWYNRSLRATVKATIDGLVYGLVTAGVFGWLWP